MTKGGKWVFGWCIVGPSGEIQIPPQAYNEYGFQPEESVIITRGNRCSGGVGMGRPEVLRNSPLQSRFVGQARIGAEGRVALPPETGVRPGERLLAVCGSGLALGFLQRGPIYEKALKHPEVETFHFIGKR
jgi:hypothetical protein